MADAHPCRECTAWCEGKDPHPGEVDDLCLTCWQIREGLAAAGWSW